MKLPRWLIVSMLIASGLPAIYVVSFLANRLVKPEFLNTSDGPIAAVRRWYHPLWYVSAERPQWDLKARDGWLEIQIDAINEGNGALYFSWDGHAAIAGYSADLRSLQQGDIVFAHFRYELEVGDDFSSRFVPSVDMVK